MSGFSITRPLNPSPFAQRCRGAFRCLYRPSHLTVFSLPGFTTALSTRLRACTFIMNDAEEFGTGLKGIAIS